MTDNYYCVHWANETVPVLYHRFRLHVFSDE